MVNTGKLNDKIKESGKKKGYLADRLSISRPYFLMKCKGVKQFNIIEVQILCDELSINSLQEKEQIFFAK